MPFLENAVLAAFLAFCRIGGCFMLMPGLGEDNVDGGEGNDLLQGVDPSRAKAALGWRAELGLADMCRSTWAWQSRNPQGYRDPGAAAG